MTISQVPATYRVSSRRDETHDTVTLTLEPAGEPIAGFRPGQFTMLYAFGIGEIPVSVSGRAGQQALAQTIRAVGAVTTALCAMSAGQVIGVRGPFGTSWDEADAAGRDLLLVAGGIGLAPLRSALLAAAQRPAALPPGGRAGRRQVAGRACIRRRNRRVASFRRRGHGDGRQGRMRAGMAMSA